MLVSESRRLVSKSFHHINLENSTFLFVFFQNIATFGAYDGTSWAPLGGLPAFSGAESARKRKFGFVLGFPMFFMI